MVYTGKTYVFYRGQTVFDNLNEEHIEHLLSQGIIVKNNSNSYNLIENNEFRHLFNEQIPLFKRKGYFNHLNERQLTCEDCGKPYSFHIRPALEQDGSINFKKIVCVCKECRTKFLKSHDIVIPQFKRDLSFEALNKDISISIRKTYGYSDLSKKLLNDTEYFKWRRLEERIYSLTKIILPPLPKEDYIHEKIRIEMEKVLIDNLGEEVNLQDPNTRIAIKKFLLGECFGICPCCGTQMTIETITIDHILAKSKKGKNSILNFIGLCEPCNQDKDAHSILEVLQRKEFKFLPVRVLLRAYAEQEYLKKDLLGIQNKIRMYLKRTYNIE